MTGISGTGQSGYSARAFQTHKANEAARIRFENALAAERTVKSSEGDSAQEKPVDVGELLEDRSFQVAQAQRQVPRSKVLQQLSKLVQDRQEHAGFDIRQ